MKYIITILLLIGILTPSFFVNAFTPNDPYLNEQWYINSLELQKVWDKAQGYNVVVAVLDSGVDTDHPDLVNRIAINQKEIGGDGIDNDGNGYIDDVKGWDFVDDDNNPQPYATLSCLNSGDCDVDAFDHGTFVSGVIAAEGNNGLGVSGIAPKAKIMPLRVLDETGTGSAETVATAVKYAVDNGADVINMSFSGLYDEPALTNAVEYAFNHNVPVVIAAGNADTKGFPINLDASPRYPICSDTKYGKDVSLGVGSHNENYVLSSFSNRGSCVNLLAPGENIFGLTVNNPSLNLTSFYKNRSQGTSYATPIVAGALALLKSYRPKLNVSQLYNLIDNSTKNIDKYNASNLGKYGTGALDILNAFNNADNSSYLISKKIQSTVNLVKIKDSKTVYFVSKSNKRYSFLDEKTYFSWFNDFSNVRTISVQELSKIPFAGVVKMKAGKGLIKVNSVPKVYAVSDDGVLRWIKSEELAKYYYGNGWNTLVNEIPASFYSNYKLGSDISQPTDYDPTAELLKYKSLDDLY